MWVGCVGTCTVGNISSYSDSVGKGDAYGKDSGLRAGVVDGALFKAGQFDVVEPRQAERGGSDERNEVDAGVTDAANPLRAARRLSGRDGVVPVTNAVWLRVRLVWRGRVSFSGALMTFRGRRFPEDTK